VTAEFVALTPVYKVFVGEETQWVRKGTIHINPAYIVSITYSTENGRAQVTLHDGTNFAVPIVQIAALVGLELT